MDIMSIIIVFIDDTILYLNSRCFPSNIFTRRKKIDLILNAKILLHRICTHPKNQHPLMMTITNSTSFVHTIHVIRLNEYELYSFGVGDFVAKIAHEKSIFFWSLLSLKKSLK